MTDSAPDIHSSDPDVVAEQAMTWFVRLRGESITPAERLQFRLWYQADSAHKQAFDETAKFWNDDSFDDILRSVALSDDIASPVSVPRTQQGRVVKFGLATAAVIMLGLSVCRSSLDCWQADYCTGVGEIKNVSLADGSSVTLNSDSAVSVNFRHGLRQVKLVKGRAFFDVKRDPQSPFLVEARYSNTKVVGTQFVVSEDRQNDRISVVSGVVEVSRDRQMPVVLKANDSIGVYAEHSSEVSKILPNSATTWIKGSVSFDAAPLSEVIAEIGRYRRGSLMIKDAGLNDLKVSGRFDITDTDKALDALQQTLPIKVYKLMPWLVVIS